jgi:putative two-component system response regulator
LSEHELTIMRRHPQIGGTIIPENASDVIRMARRISLTHHERWDGSGYPAGLKGEEIPLEGRIAAICDVYDALLSSRPYKPAWPREKAVQYVWANSGKHFDPQLVEAFLSILPEIDAIQQQYAEVV